jgi:hypothetical protein
MGRFAKSLLFVSVVVGAMWAVAQGQTPGQTPAPSQEPAAPAASQPATPTAGEFPFDRFPEFSAIMVGSILTGDEREGHIYRLGNLVRTEGGEGLGYFLTDLTKIESYSLTKMGCTKDTHPYFRAFPFTAPRKTRTMTHVAVGTETIDGHVCKIEEFTFSGGDLTQPMRVKFWEAEDMNGFPIKVTAPTAPATILYKDVVVGPLDHSLFIRPDKCTGELPSSGVKTPAPPPVRKPHAPPPSDNPQK